MNATSDLYTRREGVVFVRRADFAATPQRLGGDFWNPAQIASKAFRQFPDASAVSWEYLGTGLWADVRIHYADRSPSSARLFS